MTVKRFEELKIWQQAKELANLVYDFTNNPSFSKDRILTDQARRASVSIMANIAEGFERGSNKEFIQFLFIAKGSCGELRSHLIFANERKYINQEDFVTAIDMAAGISNMLFKFITYLQKSNIKSKRSQTSLTNSTK
ncbi:MAG: four helix bundle protein [Candidatus Edwardsbacteria bacterium]|nr:four helix bundle protein [Candidatus Edwardsbacteria bacterium]